MEHIWVKNYQEGVHAEVDVTRYANLHDILWKSIQKYPQKPAFSCMGKTKTYAEMGDLVNQFASFLQNHLKLERGERVALMMPNILQYPVALFGVLQAGLIVVNVNPLYTPRELEHQLNDSGATTIVVLENFAHTLQQALPKTAVKNIVIVRLGDLLGSLKGFLVNFAVRRIKKMVPEYQLENTILFNEALSIGSQKPFQKIDVHLDDLAFLQYTGGTTGIAKGAMLTHGNMCANMLQGLEWVHSVLKEGQETVITALPLYHVFSLTVNFMLFIALGGHDVLIVNPRDLTGFIKEFKKYPVTFFSGVNTLFNALLHHPDFSSIDFSTWKLIASGGMSLQKSVADRWQKATGLPLIEAYGLTEASPGVCIQDLSVSVYDGSIGYPIPNTAVQLRDIQGNEVPLGEAGELWVKGPQVMKGYWQRPHETEQVLQNGWLATGDIATMDEKGRIRLVDRKKDMIVVSGFNVYPNEVEDVVASMPQVREVACVGVPSEKTGEALKLFVVKNDFSLTEQEIIDYCRQEMTAYKVPRIIEFRDELPKTSVGKIMRRALRQENTES